MTPTETHDYRLRLTTCDWRLATGDWRLNGLIRAFGSPVLTRVLSDRHEALLREERSLLMRLRTALARIDASADQQEALDQSIAQLDELFLLVVVGEFNAGKSAFINALIGQPLMKEGVTPTTAVITVLEHGDREEQTVRQANRARHQGARRPAP